MGLFFTKWFQWSRGEKKRDCPDKDECLKALQLYLDGEADGVLESKLKDKLQKCMCCIEHYNLDRTIKETLRSKIEPKQCPEELAQSIRVKVRENV